MSLVKGEDAILKFYNGADYVPFACARSITLNLNAETIGTSTIGSGDWKESIASVFSWDFSMEGAVYLNDVTKATAENVIQYWLNKSVLISYFITDTEGYLIYMYGIGIITNISFNGVPFNAAGCNITGIGTGKLSTSLSFGICDEVDNGDGTTTLTFCFDSVIGASAYTIRIRDITASTTTNDTAGESPRTEIVDNTHNYAFSLKWEPGGVFGPEIFWPS